MFMESLKRLHLSMLSYLAENGGPIELQRFRSTHGSVMFECIFSTAESPYKLSLTSRGTDEHPKSEFFLFEVSKTYEIGAYLGEKYGRLAAILRTRDGASGNRLEPNKFLGKVDADTPTTASVASIPNPNDVLENRPDLTYEREKPYWSHWGSPRSKADGAPGEVSEQNRRKTAVLLGSAALKYSDELRVSSCWSAVPTRADWRVPASQTK